MSAARIVPLTRELLAMVVPFERDPVTAAMIAAGYDMDAALGVPGLAFAMIDGGYVIGAGGLVPMWMGRAAGWWIVSTEARPRHLVWAAQVAARWLDGVQRDPAYRRVEIHILADAPWRESFAAAIGFELEGRVRKWDAAGRDHCLYARIREAA